MRWIGVLLATMVVMAWLHIGATPTQAQDPTPVRGRYGALYGNNDVLRVATSGSSRKDDAGSNLSLNDLGDDVQLKPKVARDLYIAPGDGAGRGIFINDLVVVATSAPRYVASTPAGYVWMSTASVPGGPSCTNCAAYTMHGFDANAELYNQLW